MKQIPYALTALMLIVLAWREPIKTVQAQSSYAFLAPVTSLQACAWPSGMTTGFALCPITANGSTVVAFAASGGPFTVPSQGPGGAAGAPGQGFVIGTAITFKETCPKGSGSIPAGFTTSGCTLTITGLN